MHKFKITKRSGMNLLMHPKAFKLKLGISVGPSLGRMDTGFEPTRIHDISPMEVAQRARIKDMYGTYKRSKDRDVQLYILLHRSGLANSMNQARQMISHGHVYVKKMHEGKVSPIQVKRPRYHVRLNELIYIEPKYWSTIIGRIEGHWKSWGAYKDGVNRMRMVPSYVEVDYKIGTFVLINNPTTTTIGIPYGLGKVITGTFT